ncbi:putative Diaminopimelate epimerase [Desulfamplus magnetovallimortis]|uniref:Diaminopimelate epimerase n=1 Tax=Desulfamplus magnetovallimortis TaxID=1246637 RepID=A0A1W1HDP8_9BACT|nr:diaminopimelate epimerase [Desulfamplus magnetovallimortis]SLM30599.1 putative Diaminopimelate epimerase [Desulfamplus magnetovallimortis]
MRLNNHNKDWQNIPFHKLSSCGNNFIFVDETCEEYLSESDKSLFAKNVLDANFGVGADGFIIIQQSVPEVLSEINKFRCYWQNEPFLPDADYIFRMFEPNGDESLCCGNGLICIAYYLYQLKGALFSRVITEIPNKAFKIRTLGYNEKTNRAWVNMGTPERIPPFLAKVENSLLRNSVVKKVVFEIDPACKYRSDIPDTDLLSLAGYLVFTGEPHLVFLSESKVGCVDKTIKNDVDTGCGNIVYTIGKYFNNQLRDIFPYGININFVRYIKDGHLIEHRCFERGIEKETLACGTGMVASAFVLYTLGIFDCDFVKMHPYTCRQYRPDIEAGIEIRNSEYLLQCLPFWICTGEYRFVKQMHSCTTTAESETIFIDNV